MRGGFHSFHRRLLLLGTLGFDVVSSFSLADPSAKAAFLSLAPPRRRRSRSPRRTSCPPARQRRSSRRPRLPSARRSGSRRRPRARSCRRSSLSRARRTTHHSVLNPFRYLGLGARPQDNQGRGRRAAQPAHHARRLAGRRRRRDLVQQRGRRRAQQVPRPARRGGLPLPRPPRRGGREPQADALHRWRGEPSPAVPSCISLVPPPPPHPVAHVRFVARPKVVKPISSLEVAAAVAVTVAATLGVRKITARK